MTDHPEKTIPPRRLAVRALIRILDEGGFSHIAEEQVLTEAPRLDDRDRAFYHRLIKTVLEDLYRIDYVIDRHASVPVRKMKPYIRETLRTAVCQILFFDQIPDSAAVHEAVSEVKRSKFRSLSGFVNAVLRAVVRDPDRTALPEESDRTAFFSVKYSMPSWIADHFLRYYGPEKTERIFTYFNSEPGIPVRVRPPEAHEPGVIPAERIRKVRESLESEGITVSDGSAPECLRLFGTAGRGGNGAEDTGIARTEVFRTGQIAVQDDSSYLAVKAACAEFLGRDPVTQVRFPEGAVISEKTESGVRGKAGAVVCDVCAAPGGKSMAAADLLGPGTQVYAFDLTEAKCALIRENIARCGLTNMTAAVRDARTSALPAGFDPDPVHGLLPAESCDLLICDLPCSGLGIMGRKKDIRYRLRPSDLTDLAALQREILAAAADLLVPGGLLLYSTCTLDPLENEEQAAWIGSQLGFLPAGGGTFLPGESGHLSDGFYYALFRKPEGGR